ncbi:hypothetical protein AB0K18_45550 [Nonomuraea sp. NPDC049421]|uniref:hypothetical protein n=1 Tax=Nonomuraea sp. NPDC049421 TaxID=3155275 RepID=UPI0034335A94
MRVRMTMAALAAAAAVSLAPGVAGVSAASAQASPAVTSSVSASLTAASTAAAKWHFMGVFAVKQACQVAGRYYKAVGYAKDYKCNKILVGPLHRLYIRR